MGTKKLIILLLFVPFFSFGQISDLPNDVKGFWTYDSTLKDFNKELSDFEVSLSNLTIDQIKNSIMLLKMEIKPIWLNTKIKQKK